MVYRLGIDVGSTRTSATIVRDGMLAAVRIDGRSSAVSSSSLAPAVWSECGGRAEPESIAAAVAEVIERVRRTEGCDADAIAVTYSPTWSSQQVARLRACLREYGVNAGVLSAARAAATAAAERDRLQADDVCAVIDIGMHESTITVLQMAETGGAFAQLAVVAGSALSGRLVDQAIHEHLMNCLMAIAGPTMEELLDPSNPESGDVLRSLRNSCEVAKEALARSSETSIEVDIPNVATRVRITRDELSRALAEPLQAGREALAEAVHAVGAQLEDLTAVLLVGGSARLPLFASMVCDELGEESEVVRDLDPMLANAAGAALALYRVAPQSGDAPALAARGSVTNRLADRLTGAAGLRAPGQRRGRAANAA